MPTSIIISHLQEILPRPLIRHYLDQGMTPWQIFERYMPSSKEYPNSGTAEPYNIEQNKIKK